MQKHSQLPPSKTITAYYRGASPRPEFRLDRERKLALAPAAGPSPDHESVAVQVSPIASVAAGARPPHVPPVARESSVLHPQRRGHFSVAPSGSAKRVDDGLSFSASCRIQASAVPAPAPAYSRSAVSGSSQQSASVSLAK